MTALHPPERIWWKPADRWEKLWITLAFLWAFGTFLMMPIWHFTAKQNPTGMSKRVDPKEYQRVYEEFVSQHKVGEEQGFPVVEPPPGGDVYLLARQFNWLPVLKLKKGQEYRIHISSLDVQHGFSLQPVNMNFMALPGWDYTLTFTPTQEGTYTIICNEFCGLGHHMMTGRIYVE